MKTIFAKRRWLATLTLSALALTLFSLVSCSKSTPAAKASDSFFMEVHKTPTCGCCGDWVKHLEESGFNTKVNDHASLSAIKKQLNIRPELQSCHTGVSPEGFFFEGHIPSKYITQFLAKPPQGAAGLTVPGMPVGSPGMEMGERFSPYDILLVKKDGTTAVFAKVSTAEEQF